MASCREANTLPMLSDVYIETANNNILKKPLAILYSLPSYRQYIVRTNTVAAQQYLLELVSLQNQTMFENHGYTEKLETLGVPPLERVKNHYDVAITNVSNTATPPTYSIQATPKFDSAQAKTSTLTINHLGQKTGDWYE